MAIKDHKKFADAIVLEMCKKSKPDDTEEPNDSEDSKDKEDENKPGDLGRKIAAALRHNDYEALEEAIKEIRS